MIERNFTEPCDAGGEGVPPAFFTCFGRGG
jgi:hypothetical protein